MTIKENRKAIRFWCLVSPQTPYNRPDFLFRKRFGNIHHFSIKIKRDCYKDLKKNYDGLSFERYKLVKKETKKAVQNAKAKMYKEVYEKLDTKEVEKDIYRISRIRERKTRDLYTMRCGKDEDQKI